MWNVMYISRETEFKKDFIDRNEIMEVRKSNSTSYANLTS